MANHESWARQRVLYMMAQASTANWRIRITLHNESAYETHNTYVGVVQLCALPRQCELTRSTVNSTMDKCMHFTYVGIPRNNQYPREAMIKCAHKI